jgi:hypothetical protein
MPSFSKGRQKNKKSKNNGGRSVAVGGRLFFARDRGIFFVCVVLVLCVVYLQHPLPRSAQQFKKRIEGKTCPKKMFYLHLQSLF